MYIFLLAIFLQDHEYKDVVGQDFNGWVTHWTFDPIFDVLSFKFINQALQIAFDGEGHVLAVSVNYAYESYLNGQKFGSGSTASPHKMVIRVDQNKPHIHSWIEPWTGADARTLLNEISVGDVVRTRNPEFFGGTERDCRIETRGLSSALDWMSEASVRYKEKGLQGLLEKKPPKPEASETLDEEKSPAAPAAEIPADAQVAENPFPQTGISVETSRDDIGAYLKILRQLVKGNWRIPPIGRYEVSGVAVVYFKLYKDGRITEAAVVSSSTYEELDSSALKAVTNSYQAPPLPPNVEEEWLPMKFGFYYNIRPNFDWHTDSDPTKTGNPTRLTGLETKKEIYRVGQAGVEPPVFSKRVQPVFPKEAVKVKLQGYVILEALFKTDGTVQDITVIRGLGKGKFGFEEAATEALKSWEFMPGKANGLSADVWMTVKIDFILQGE